MQGRQGSRCTTSLPIMSSAQFENLYRGMQKDMQELICTLTQLDVFFQ